MKADRNHKARGLGALSHENFLGAERMTKIKSISLIVECDDER